MVPTCCHSAPGRGGTWTALISRSGRITMEIIGQPLLRSPGRQAWPCSLRTLRLRQAPSLGGVAQVVLNPLLLCCGLHSTTRDGLHDDIEELENRCGLAAPSRPSPLSPRGSLTPRDDLARRLTEVTRSRERMRAENVKLRKQNSVLREEAESLRSCSPSSSNGGNMKEATSAAGGGGVGGAKSEFTRIPLTQ